MAKLYKLHTGSPHQRLQGLLCLLRLRQPWSQVGGMAAMAGECTRELRQPASRRRSLLGLSSLLCPAEGKEGGATWPLRLPTSSSESAFGHRRQAGTRCHLVALLLHSHSGSLTGRTGAEQPTLGTKAGEHTSWLVDRTDYLKKIDFKKSCFP